MAQQVKRLAVLAEDLIPSMVAQSQCHVVSMKAELSYTSKEILKTLKQSLGRPRRKRKAPSPRTREGQSQCQRETSLTCLAANLRAEGSWTTHTRAVFLSNSPSPLDKNVISESLSRKESTGKRTAGPAARRLSRHSSVAKAGPVLWPRLPADFSSHIYMIGGETKA